MDDTKEAGAPQGGAAAQAETPSGRVRREDPAAWAIVTFFGAGTLPVAPGTWGSLAALPVAWLAWLAGDGWAVLGLALAAAAAGVAASNRAVAISRVKDPSFVVIDEVAGQSLALALPLLVAPRPGAWGLGLLFALAFVLFRVVDVWKPGPVGDLESLPDGWGVMADDVAGGFLVGVLLAAGRATLAH